MGRIISFALIMLLVLSGLVGCSAQKSEAELKEEIKKELAAEMAKEQAAQKEQNNQPAQAEQPAQNSSAQPVSQDAVNKTSLLKEYEVNKEYKYDIDGDGGVDSFRIETDTWNYYNLFINQQKFNLPELAKIGDSQLLQGKYRLTKIADSNRYAFTIFAAAPPAGEDVYFYEYEIRSKLTQIGYATTDNINGKSTFNNDITSLTYNQVKFGTKTFTFSGSAGAAPAASTEEPENLKLSGFSNEKINGTQVNYSDYRAVIVPMYAGLNSLESVKADIGSVTQGPQGMQANFAIFGQLFDIKITYFQGMGAEGETIDVGTLYNSNVNIRVWMPIGDTSFIKVTGVAFLGMDESKDVEFTLDDMRDRSDYKLIMFK